MALGYKGTMGTTTRVRQQGYDGTRVQRGYDGYDNKGTMALGYNKGTMGTTTRVRWH